MIVHILISKYIFTFNDNIHSIVLTYINLIRNDDDPDKKEKVFATRSQEMHF